MQLPELFSHWGGHLEPVLFYNGSDSFLSSLDHMYNGIVVQWFLCHFTQHISMTVIQYKSTVHSVCKYNAILNQTNLQNIG